MKPVQFGSLFRVNFTDPAERRAAIQNAQQILGDETILKHDVAGDTLQLCIPDRLDDEVSLAYNKEGLDYYSITPSVADENDEYVPIFRELGINFTCKSS